MLQALLALLACLLFVLVNSGPNTWLLLTAPVALKTYILIYTLIRQYFLELFILIVVRALVLLLGSRCVALLYVLFFTLHSPLYILTLYFYRIGLITTICCLSFFLPTGLCYANNKLAACHPFYYPLD